MSPIETEVKIPLPNPGSLLEQLSAAEFTISVSRQLEVNDIYDTPAHDLRRSGKTLRLRSVGPNAIVTLKGPPQPGPHKSRPEYETAVHSLPTMHQIFEQLGYAPIFRYEKYRTEFTGRDRLGAVTLDETPIGVYLEIEGPGEWIDRTAARLGFSPQDYILESYGKLYLDHCARLGIPSSNMVFAESREGQPVT